MLSEPEPSRLRTLKANRVIAESFTESELLKVGNRSYVNAFMYPESRFDAGDLQMDMLQPIQDPLKRFFDQAVVPPSYLIFKVDGYVLAKRWDGQIGFSGTDVAKIINAICAEATGGSVVLFKSDDYTFNSKATVSKSVTLDLGKSTLHFSTPITLFDVNSAQVNVIGGVVKGNNVNGEVAFNLLSGSHGCLFENVRFDHVYEPFYLNGSIWEFRAYGVSIDYCNTALKSASTATDVNVNLRDFWASHVDGDAIVLYNTNAVLMHNCEIMSVPNGSPLKIKSRYGGDIWISHCEFDNYMYPIEVGPNVPDYHFDGCYMNQGYNVEGGHAIRIYDGTYGGRVRGCHISSAGGHGIYVSGTSTMDTHLVDNRITVMRANKAILLENCVRVKCIMNQVSGGPIEETGVSDWNSFFLNSGTVIKVGHHSKIVSGMDTEADIFRKDGYQIPLGLNNTYGNAVVDVPESGQLRVFFIRIMIENMGGETITVKVRAYNDDDTTKEIERSWNANGNYDLSAHDLFDLMTHNRRIIKLEFYAKTTASSSNARVYRQVWGI